MINLLNKKGNLVIEVQYLLNTLKDLTFDNIYHEHYNYWSLTSLVNFFKNYKVKLYRAEKINTHGGSLRIYLNKDLKTKIEKNVSNLLKEEEKFGIKKFETYKKFGEKIYQIRENVIKNFNKLKDINKNLVGYGAPAKATTALNFFGISGKINSIIEDNKLKQGKYLPGLKIPIINNNKKIAANSCLIVLAWNFYNEIKKKNKYKFKKIINIKSLEKENFFDE